MAEEGSVRQQSKGVQDRVRARGECKVVYWRRLNKSRASEVSES